MNHTPASTWTPYGEGVAPQSATGTVLSEVMADYCREQWGMGPHEVLAALQGSGSQDDVYSIATTVAFLSGLMLTGELPTSVRPFGGGEPKAFAPGCWEIDDPRRRFVTSAVNPDRWTEELAAPSHWIFVESAAYDRFIEEWCRPGDAPVAGLDVAEAGPPGAAQQRAEPSQASGTTGASTRPPRSSSTPTPTASAPPTESAPPPPAAGHVSARPRTMIRLAEVIARTAVSRSQIYKRMDLKTFPASVELGGRMVGWYEDEIDVWVAERQR